MTKAKKKFPKWFSYYSKPWAPTKPHPPEETIELDGKVEELLSIKGEQRVQLTKELLAKLSGTDQPIYLCLQDGTLYDCERESPTASLQLISHTKAPNPHYEREKAYYTKSLKEYEAEQEVYKEQRKLWPELKKEWEEQERIKRVEHAKRVLERDGKPGEE